MTEAPLQVLTRPFAIEPVTNVMLPDGIFDNAIYNLRIAAHFTNLSGGALTNAKIYLESVGDPGIVPVSKTFNFPEIPAGASVLVVWDANFQNATPGKRLVSFVAGADGFTPKRSIRQIFVSQTRYNGATNSYTCTVEEGTMTVSNISAIAPGAQWGEHTGTDRKCKCPPEYGPWVPTGMTLHWAPSPAYAGVHGDLPFSDPWWKILAWIVAAIAALVAIIAAAVGAGTASFGASGTFDESQPSVQCCTPESPNTGGKPGFTVAGVASSIAVGAAVVGMTDFADPFWRGQEATPPSQGEMTVGERVVATWTLPDAPNAGAPYPVDIKWTYTRFTTGKSYDYSVSETPTNTHTSDGVDVETPVTIHALDPLWVRSKFHKQGGELFKGSELYAFALFRAPQGMYFVVPLSDDGLGFDPAANDGVYAGSLDLERARRLLLEYKQDVFGTWRIYVYAQDVNSAKPGTPPQISAQNIGGFFIASSITLKFDPSLPCPLKAQGTITVV